jgi:hypothetical protein
MALVTLTQGHLKLLERCPRRFQYTYLDQLAAPTDPAVLQRQQWGTRFHLVMQQRELGLSIAPLLAQEPDLEAAVQALLTTAPDLFAAESSSPNPANPEGGSEESYFRQSEHRRSLAFNGHGLTVVYDLLIMTPTQGQIIDWKTHRHPPSAAQLAQDWQTRLYLYVLAETTVLAPEQLAMIYWFVQPPRLPASVEGLSASADQRPIQASHISMTYSTAEHHRTEHDLRCLTDQLNRFLNETPHAFSKVKESEGQCLRCPFAVRCQRSSDQYTSLAAMTVLDIEDIAELPL